VVVPPGPANDPPVPASPEHARAGPILVPMREGSPVRAGAHLEEGEDLVTPWHHHDMHQLQYAFSGVVEVESATGRHLLPPQQAAWIPAGLEHRTTLRHVRSGAVFFDPSMVEDRAGRVRILAAVPVIRELMAYAMRWPITRPASDPTADACFEALALLTSEWLDSAEAPLRLPTSDEPVIREVMTFTEVNLRRVTASMLCAAVGLSERSLRRRFVKATGMTWQEYRRTNRVLRAMALLAESDHTVVETATAVGFESLSAFNRAFRDLTGEQPTAYRRRVSTCKTGAS